MAALTDRPRPLGRPRFAPEERVKVIAAATAVPPDADTTWSHRLLAEHLSELGISALQIGRILATVDLKPHLVRGWLSRPADPQFFDKAADICAVYRSCPPNAVVLSVDEKTGITARSRKHPDTPARPKQPTRREFEYVRHGTVQRTRPAPPCPQAAVTVPSTRRPHLPDHRHRADEPVTVPTTHGFPVDISGDAVVCKINDGQQPSYALNRRGQAD